MEAEAEVVSVKKTPESKVGSDDFTTQKTKKGKVVTKTRIISPSSSPQQSSKAKAKKRRK